MQIQISTNLKKLATLLPCDLFVVGGYVRNSFMGIQLDDIDICSKLTLDELAQVLNNTDFSVKLRSKILGTALIVCDNEQYEYSCFRREVYGNDGEHSPIKVEFIDSVEEDSKRRDFSINCIYYNINRDEILDFYKGIEDIQRKTLKTIETPEVVLSNDGVRILRLFRFQCELGFKIDKSTLLAAIKYASNVRDLSGERVTYEMQRVLHSSNHYKGHSKNNAFMKAFKIFNTYSLWRNFGMDVPRIKFKMIKKVESKVQGFLIDLIDTVNPISISYYLEHFLNDEIGLSKKMTPFIINVLSGYYDALNGLENKPYFFKYFDSFPTIHKLLTHKSKFLAGKYEFFYKYIIGHKLVISVKDLKINGDDIKRAFPQVDQKRYKAILNSLLNDVFDGILVNTKQDLIEAIDGKLKYL